MMDAEGNTNKLDELRSYLRKHMYSYGGYDMYSPMEKCTMPRKFRDIQQRIRDLEVYEDDTWILNYPRTGSTWTRAMFWLIANDLDYSGAKANLFIRFLILELDMHPQARNAVEVNSNCKIGDTIEYVKKMRRPRFIWSHLPLTLLPSQLLEKKPKMVLMTRNPKDVALSFYHYLCSAEGYIGTADTFFEVFKEGLWWYGCYWHHLASFRKLFEEPFVLSLTYEDMKQDCMSVLRKTANFFCKNYTDDELKKLESYLNLSYTNTNKTPKFKGRIDQTQVMQKHSESNSDYLRKIVDRGYGNEMSEETKKKFDDWSNAMKNKLNLTDDKNIPY